MEIKSTLPGRWFVQTETLYVGWDTIVDYKVGCCQKGWHLMGDEFPMQTGTVREALAMFDEVRRTDPKCVEVGWLLYLRIFVMLANDNFPWRIPCSLDRAKLTPAPLVEVECNLAEYEEELAKRMDTFNAAHQADIRGEIGATELKINAGRAVKAWETKLPELQKTWERNEGIIKSNIALVTPLIVDYEAVADFSLHTCMALCPAQHKRKAG